MGGSMTRGYINPSDGRTKEQWLAEEARQVGSSDLEITADELPVVLVDNRVFTAAGICATDRDLQEFTNPRDRRPRRFFMAPRAKLAEFL